MFLTILFFYIFFFKKYFTYFCMLALLIFQIFYIINILDVFINKFILAVKTRNKRICSQNLSLTQDKLRTRLVRNHEVIIFTLEIHFTRLYFANVSMKSILVLLTGAQGQVVELRNQIRHLDNTM